MKDNLVPEEILQRIRDKVAESKFAKAPAAWKPPSPEDITPETQILCFDQALSNVGWSLVNTDDGKITVIDSGTLRPPALGSSVRGFEATLVKSVFVARDVRDLLGRLYGQWESVVLELPSVVGYRTESSLVAAATIFVELDRVDSSQPQMVSRNAAAATLCGDRYAPKSTSSTLVNTFVQEHPTGTGQWTEHVRDSVFVGLKHLYLEQM